MALPSSRPAMRRPVPLYTLVRQDPATRDALWHAVTRPACNAPILDDLVRAVSAFSGWRDLCRSCDRFGYVPTVYRDGGGLRDLLALALVTSGRRVYRGADHGQSHAVARPDGVPFPDALPPYQAADRG